ncbi:MAG: glycosyltransferase [Elusimicrobia bacterium]|nr:glycosyltransferase [Elusimicrobiota bacterium]
MSPAAAPLVTVIINAYNGEKFIRQAIASVYAQTMGDFEIVLFDDASTDATGRLAQGFDERLRYFRSDRLIPLGEARNKALELSRGRYISFLDQDDIFLPEKLEKQVAAFQADVALVFCNSIRFWENTGREALLYDRRPPDGDAFRALLGGYYLQINTVMIRRSALPEDRAWWFCPSFRMCEETDLFLRLAYRHPIAYVDEPLAKYRIHGQNFSVRRREYLISEQEAILKRLEGLVPDFAILYAREISRLSAEIRRAEAQIHWKEGRRLRAWKAYLEGMRRNPRPVYAAEMALSLLLPFGALPVLREWLGKPI